jgi:hypothetical protein
MTSLPQHKLAELREQAEHRKRLAANGYDRPAYIWPELLLALLDAYERSPSPPVPGETEKIADWTIAELEAICAGATPGPWSAEPKITIHDQGYGVALRVADGEPRVQISGSGGARSYTSDLVKFDGTDDDAANARFIAASRTALPAALERIRELEGEYSRDVTRLHSRALAAEARADSASTDVVRLREALEPFTKEAAKYDPPEHDDAVDAWGTRFRIGDLRHAARVYNETEPTNA